MPPMAKEKAGPLSTKAIGNRIKAKGLQKLRWYCQMCQKQCRDENGFKCHCMSESHQRQMLVFAENPTSFMDEYSKTFEEDFIEMIKFRYCEKRIKANDAYKEFISDRHHQHMNSTCWQTLTDFVIYLGRTGKCKVDQTPKGWFMTYINRDPAVIAKREAIEKKERMDQADEDIAAATIEHQIKLAKQHAEETGTGKKREEATDLLRNEDDDSKIALALSSSKGSKTMKVGGGLAKASMSFTEDDGAGPSQPADGKKGEKRKLSMMESMAMQHEKEKEKKARKDYWLAEGIVVKVMNKEIVDGKYYKRKGVVRKVVDKYVGIIKMADDGVKLKLDQDQLETVIPNPGGRVYVVNGAYRGATAVVKALDTDNFSVSVEIREGGYRGKSASLDYEDVCKLDIQD